MIRIGNSIRIDEGELDFIHMRSSGPGGQNVNKVSTGIQLRFDVKNTGSLDKNIKRRLMNIAGNRITSEGMLLINATNYRTQYQNKQDAIKRFIDLVKKSVVKPSRRIYTNPPRGSRLKRLEDKRKRSRLKNLRKRDFGRD